MAMNSLKVVAIDDNHDNLITLKAVMLDALPGCELFTAINGVDGIELTRQHDPDVILLDIVMPGMDGFEVCRRLKADSELSDIPVLFLTALRADPKSRTKAIDVGAEGFLAKPIDEIELIAQVRTMAKIRAANRLQRMERQQLEALVIERTRELEHELAERKRMEIYRGLASEVLRLLNDPDDLKQVIQRVLDAVQKTTDCQAVGIRLQSKDDFPYYLQQGFSSDFLLTENSIIERDTNGTVCLDDDGIPSLECTCGLVITGKMAVDSPYITPSGGYWSGSELPDDLPSVYDNRHNPRDICLHQGYTSVALLPIRSAQQTVGLLQVCDRRKGILHKELIHTLEGIASTIGQALLRRQVEDALKRSHELLTRLAEQVPGVVYQYRLYPDGRSCFPYSSPGMNDIYGVTPEEVREDATPIFGRLHPDDYDDILASINESARTLQLFHSEYRVILPGQGTRWRLCDAKPELMDDGSVLWYGIISDITERKQAEEQLKQFKTIFDTANFGAAIADMDGYLTYVNDSMAEIHGYTASEMLGKPLFMCHNTQQLEQVRPLMQQMEVSGGFYAEEVSHYHRDGSTFSMLMTGTLVRDASGKPQCYTVTALDLSERKALEEQLQQAQKMESVGRLAGGVAHDFNNMLNVILGYTELISQSLATDDPIRSDLGEVKKAAEHSAELTRQLLAFARKQTVVLKVLDFNETIDSSINMIRRLIGEGIDLTWDPGKSVGQVRMDPSQIGQILTNLCANASDAIGGVGHITITTGSVHSDQDVIAHRPDLTQGDYVTLTISDDGCGMSEQTLDKLFEPFFTTKEMGKGTGLGLATVYGIVKQNDGAIEVESQPGQGTTFHIYLPRHLGQKEHQELAEDVPTAGVAQETVMIVEDESAILKLGKRMLEKLGYNVLAALSPTEALRLAEEYPGDIDLLLTDVVMPQMNGRDLARKLIDLYPNMKRIYMSGYTADVIAHQGVVDKDVHFIQKPFTMREMASKLQEVLTEEA